MPLDSVMGCWMEGLGNVLRVGPDLQVEKNRAEISNKVMHIVEN